MQIMYPKDNLLPQKLGFSLTHLFIRLALQMAMQRSSINVLHDHKNLLVRIEDLVQLSKAVMVDLLHDFDFSLHTLSSVWVLQLALLINLNRDLLI